MRQAGTGHGQAAAGGAISLARIFFSRLANLTRVRAAARRAGGRRPQFEILEPRFLLSADLVGSVQMDAPGLLLPGDHERATVVVRNVGDAASNGRVDVQLYASADGVLDASDILLDTGKISGRLLPGASKDAKLNFDIPDGLLPGHYTLLAVVDSSNQVHESNEANNVAVGPQFDVAWMFGGGPGHSRDSLLVHDADGTRVLFSLSGPGTGEITVHGGQWDVELTGTAAGSVFTVLTLGGGDGRVALDDIHATGALGAMLAPTTDLTGTLAIGGPLTAGLLLGSATDALIAAPTITGTSFLGLSVKGIAILGDLENSRILIGANLGADGQPGGTGANADAYSAGQLGDLLIGGSMFSSSVRVGQDPVDGIFDNGDDRFYGGASSNIRSITILGGLSADSFFVAGAFPAKATVHGEKIDTASDPRFRLFGTTGTNHAPVALDDSFSTDEDVALTISAASLLANDTDVDGDTLTIASFTQAAHGTVGDNLDGTYTYTPNLNFNGQDSFSYTISDSHGGTDTASVALTVNAVNDAPVLDAIADQTVDEGTTLSFTVTARDADLPANGLTYSLDAAAPSGASITAGGVFSWSPTEAQGPGDYSITVRVTDDGTPAKDDAQAFQVHVNEVNLAPVLDAISNKLSLINVQLNVQTHATDPDLPSNNLTYSLVGTVPAGAAINSAGLFTWTPTAFGTSSFTVRVADNGSPSLSDQKTFSVTVVAPPRIAIDDVLVVEGDSGTTDALFRVFLSGPAPEQGVSVNYANSGITNGVPGVDFIARSGTLTFAPGETEKTFAVPIIGDTVVEVDKVFIYQLSGAVNGTLSTKSLGVGTILDNDDHVTRIGIDRRAVMEGDSGATDVVFNVLLSSPSTSTVTVNYGMQNGGTDVNDFVTFISSGSLTFAPGETRKTITVQVRGDTDVESDETFTVRLTGPVNATISDTVQPGNGVIVNDDGPGLMLAASIEANAAAGSTPDAATLDCTLDAAIALWTRALGAGDPRLARLDAITIGTAHFAGAALAGSWGSAIYVDTDAAGHGWFADLTPMDSNEFRLHLGGGALGAAPSSEAFGHMDLLTVVMHEVGHVLGFGHDDAARYAVMREQLDAGVRYVPAPARFDFESAAARGARATIAWDAELDWGAGGAPFGRPAGALFADFRFKP